MKRHYWFVALFGVWCIASAWWLLGPANQASPDPLLFDSGQALRSVVAVLVVLLGACLLGYGIAWYLRDESIARDQERIVRRDEQHIALRKEYDQQAQQVGLWRDKYQDAVRASRAQRAQSAAEKELLEQKLAAWASADEKSRTELQAGQIKIEQLESAEATLRYRVRQLEFQIEENEQKIHQLNLVISAGGVRASTPVEATPLFARPVAANQKDELTKIRGIGPFIEKRLNKIGIYTFQQLAALRPDQVNLIGTVIEFFPHRIVKDDWVGQANRFLKS